MDVNDTSCHIIKLYSFMKCVQETVIKLGVNFRTLSSTSFTKLYNIMCYESQMVFLDD